MDGARPFLPDQVKPGGRPALRNVNARSAAVRRVTHSAPPASSCLEARACCVRRTAHSAHRPKFIVEKGGRWLLASGRAAQLHAPATFGGKFLQNSKFHGSGCELLSKKKKRERRGKNPRRIGRSTPPPPPCRLKYACAPALFPTSFFPFSPVLAHLESSILICQQTVRPVRRPPLRRLPVSDARARSIPSFFLRA